MGVVRERQGRLEDALALYRGSLEKHDEASEMLSRRLGAARSLVLLGRHEAAEVEFAAAARVATDPLSVPIERAETWLRAGDPTRALAALEAVPAPVERSARGSFALARALLGLGRVDEARRAARRAVDLDPASERYQALVARLRSSLPGTP